MTTVNFLVVAALVATLVILWMGLRSMARGGDYDKEHAEKFMWERVALKAIVVILMVAATILLNM
jgi:succinate dehydrogenase hydrophobic anchor subunit